VLETREQQQLRQHVSRYVPLPHLQCRNVIDIACSLAICILHNTLDSVTQLVTLTLQPKCLCFLAGNSQVTRFLKGVLAGYLQKQHANLDNTSTEFVRVEQMQP
jgi:hypothetical protein